MIPGIIIDRTRIIHVIVRPAMMINKILTCLLLLTLLTACASGPRYDTGDINLQITPLQVVSESGQWQDARVLWGGLIVASANLRDKTQIEILAYPLDSSQRPVTDKAPMGRFLAQQPGYLETTDYTQGRLLTITGTVQGITTGKVGESEYTYPVVRLADHYLWPQRDGSPETRVHFGIGVQIRN